MTGRWAPTKPSASASSASAAAASSTSTSSCKCRRRRKGVVPVAVCDVWDGDAELGSGKGRGLYPTAKRCGIDTADKKHVTKDYRVILDQKDVDVVVVATPGSLACQHVPSTPSTPKQGRLLRKADDAHHRRSDRRRRRGQEEQSRHDRRRAVDGRPDLARRPTNTSGRQDRPRPAGADQLLSQFHRRPMALLPAQEGDDAEDDRLGHVARHTSSSAPAQKLGPTAKEMPFDRAVWAQWRCYWPFGGGMFTDLFVHQTTHLISAMGVRFPGRVVGAGGIYLEYDGRDVPDVATVVADYNEGCQVIISATMCNNTQLGEIIRGHLATIKLQPGYNGDYIRGFEVFAQEISGGPSKPQGGFSAADLHVQEPEVQGQADPSRDGNLCPVGKLPRLRRQGRSQHDEHPRTGCRGVLDGQHGCAQLPLRQGLPVGQAEACPEGSGRQLGNEARNRQQKAWQADTRSWVGKAVTAAAP